ncbi:MAG: universal stress protein [Candidatus Dormibacteria bacterium]
MFREIYVPIDNSEHSNGAIQVAVALARDTGARLTGCHVYAARMHDVRFKQMEYTLPEEYQDEQELERQRKIHDSLITRGLQLISDSYLDVLKEAADAAGVEVDYKTFDGKNWECLAKDITDSAYDLVVMGALGMGAVKDSQVGSVVDRVVRRTRTDSLIVRDVHPLSDKASDRIVVAVDGSPQSFAAVKTAIALSRIFGKKVEAVAVYDPYLHYSMFNGIVDVLSAEASKVFRFKEQEQLHEEIIDSGLARIYESHLKVARSVAQEDGVELKTTLLDGKAFKKVLQFLRDEPPWLLLAGRIGVHSHEDMDIGSNSDNLMRMAPCSVLLGSRTYVPPVDVQAEASVVWTEEAESRMEEVPAHVRGVVRSAICRYAMERGNSVISSSVIDEAVADIMPERAAASMGVKPNPRPASMTEAAVRDAWVCQRCGRPARDRRPEACPVCGGTELLLVAKDDVRRAAEREGGIEEEAAFDGFTVQWTKDGKQSLDVVPKGYERRRVKAVIEKMARMQRLGVITREFADAKVAEAWAPVSAIVGDAPAIGNGNGHGNGVGLATAGATGWVATPRDRNDAGPHWTDEATVRLDRVPAGFMRTMARTKVDEYARKIGADRVTLDVCEGGLTDARELMGQMMRSYGPDAEKIAHMIPGHGPVAMAPEVENPAPGWTEDGVRRLNEVEVQAAQRFDPARAREMAEHAAESRAARTGEALNAAFLERLGVKLGYGHPLAGKTYEHAFTWTPEAEERLRDVPDFCRELTRWRVEWTAVKKGLGTEITPDKMDVKYDMWGEVSHEMQAQGPSMPWSDEAEKRVARIPDFVKGQVMQAVEGNARDMGREEVTGEVLDGVIEKWIATGDFHEGRFGFRA